jgi:peptidoglycan/LPS O-acetylase OafA/YrhL
MYLTNRSLPQPREKLDALTGLRFFAAFAVFNFHYLSPQSWPIRFPPLVVSIIGSGNSGVSLFFMLSGFVLAYANSDWAGSRQETLRFWSNRIARIYPTYLLAMVWFAPFVLWHRFASEPAALAISKSFGSFVPALFLVQSWFYPRLAVAWNGPAWTLSVEAAFYLTFPVIARRLRQLSQPHKLLLCLGCWIASTVISLIDPLLIASTPIRDAFFTYNPLCHLPTFISGVALGYHYAQRPSVRGHGAVLAWIGLLATAAIAAIAWTLPFLFALEAAFLPAFALLLYGLALGGWPTRVLSVRPLVILGEASYSLYVLQFSIVFTLMWVQNGFVAYDVMAYGRIHPGFSWPLFYFIAALVSTVTSIAVWKYYETPLRRGLRGWLGDRLVTQELRFE